ncbi:Bug family tripartite tricarboxylate transporter substrate binding protein [Comamonas sp. J-3]|uniref:Bug family tripartite tricarboxylate transporter substrate binding protein n=1 Tax=Comamonas trifloxystrobinivorans TaxID=3350256 RepID=UPI00372B0FCE
MPSHSRSLRRRFLLALAGLTPLLAALPPAIGQTTNPANWPTKPMRIIVPYSPGGNADAIARFVADKLGVALGQSIMVENKTGAGAIIGTEAAARAAGDGYTFLVAPNAVFTITQHLRAIPYKPDQDFIPIAQLSGSYSIAAARKDAPFNTLRELVAQAKKNPGKFSYGSAGLATATHLSGEMLSSVAGIQLLHVPYKGSADALSDLMGGRIDLQFDPVSLAQIQNGNAKAIGVLSRVRHPELPDIPTAKEQGLNVDSRSWFGLFAPKNTPQAIVERMAAETEKILQLPTTREMLLKFSQYPDYLPSQAFARKIQDDSAFFKQLIQANHIQVE